MNNLSIDKTIECLITLLYTNTSLKIEDKYMKNSEKYSDNDDSDNDIEISYLDFEIVLDDYEIDEEKIFAIIVDNYDGDKGLFEINNDQYFQLEKDLAEYLKNIFNEKDSVFYDGTIILHNNSGFNHDYRGSNEKYCRAPLEYRNKIKLIKPTFGEFLKALYLLKSHKFDDWYELYCSSDVICNKNKTITINLHFDHGS
jgi:hypothetical protein